MDISCSRNATEGDRRLKRKPTVAEFPTVRVPTGKIPGSVVPLVPQRFTLLRSRFTPHVEHQCNSGIAEYNGEMLLKRNKREWLSTSGHWWGGPLQHQGSWLERTGSRLNRAGSRLKWGFCPFDAGIDHQPAHRRHGRFAVSHRFKQIALGQANVWGKAAFPWGAASIRCFPPRRLAADPWRRIAARPLRRSPHRCIAIAGRCWNR